MEKGVSMPGFNPKDSAETYVRKILSNQQRMENTIKRYEEQQKQKKAQTTSDATVTPEQ